LDPRLALPVNAILDGNYRIARVVGAGGFAVTYEAEDVLLRKRVAVKEYYPIDFCDRDAKMRVLPKSEVHKTTFESGRSNFLEEARTLARFEHPSIVRVLRVFEANSTAYTVMHFEEGRSFETWLTSLRRAPMQEELDAIVAALLDALDLIHSAGILHRDIAPDNIIIRADGSPVLLDFGAARRADAAAGRALTGVIKAGYSPPEQYTSNCRLQGPWSDFYALGGTLYRAVTGQAPEEAMLRLDEDSMTTAAKAANGKFRSGFLGAIDACLEVRHSDRPQSGETLRSLLFGQRLWPTAGSLRALVHSVNPAARHWIVSAATAMVLLGGYGGVEFTGWQASRQSRQPIAATTGRPLKAASVESQTQEEGRRKQEELSGREKRAAEERARQETVAKREADSVATKIKSDAAAQNANQFDGDWEVTGLGGDGCRFKNWKYRISIQNDRILVPQLPPGKVNTAGGFTYRYVAVGWRNAPPGTFAGKLAGGEGSGSYNYSNFCRGTMRLKRV
jgi:serine/threonine protein kinase